MPKICFKIEVVVRAQDRFIVFVMFKRVALGSSFLFFFFQCDLLQYTKNISLNAADESESPESYNLLLLLIFVDNFIAAVLISRFILNICKDM